MTLTEQHIIKDDRFKDWCIKAKNLYNQSLYYWRQSVFGNIQYFSEYELLKLFREFNEENYRQLPSHCGQEILKNLFQNIKRWQKAKKEYKINPSKFLGRPKMPKYKKEMSILSFNNFQIKLKDGYVHFPKMIGVAPMKTNVPNINSCRVVPKSNHFLVEFSYTVPDVEIKEYNGNALGIDLGLNNLSTCVTTNGNAFIVNGKPLKAINAFYNRRKADLQSKLQKESVNRSKRLERLTFSRNNKIKDYLHKASKFIVEKAIELDVTKIVIGNNKHWKQEIRLGKRTNQNFVSIPHSNLIEKIEYKAKLAGIEVVRTEESYTSKCSALDLESICKHEKYVGCRTKRGLFRTADGTKINADCNGATNILRKVLGDDIISDSIRSAVIAPVKKRSFKQKLA
jgi:putative transposase